MTTGNNAAFDMPVLALDTSTAALCAAVVREGRVLADDRSIVERAHSVLAVPMVKDVLAKAGVKPDELGGIAVGCGPGSYTGVRIAVTIAKTLAWAWRVPLAGVSSLEALALSLVAHPDGLPGEVKRKTPGAQPQQNGSANAATADAAAEDNAVTNAETSDAAGENTSTADTDTANAATTDAATKDIAVSNAETLDAATEDIANADTANAETADAAIEWIVPLMDARRGQVYTACFAADAAGGWRRLAADGVRLMQDWADELAAIAEGAGRPAAAGPARIRFTGDPSRHLDAIRALGERLDGKVQVEVQPVHMEGRSIAALGIRRFAAGEADDPHGLVPNYTQLAEAEAKLLAARQGG